MINALIVDLTETSRSKISEYKPKTVSDVRSAPPMIAFSEAMQAEATMLKRFLRKNLYQHYLVNRMTSKARRIITELFNVFMAEPTLLPPDYQPTQDDTTSRARRVSDYIAGMTDRYAMREYRRMFSIEEI